MLKMHRKDLPVVSYVEGVETLGEALHVVWTDLLQKVNVVLGVKPAHVMLRRLVWFKHLYRERERALFINISREKRHYRQP